MSDITVKWKYQNRFWIKRQQTRVEIRFNSKDDWEMEGWYAPEQPKDTMYFRGLVTFTRYLNWEYAIDETTAFDPILNLLEIIFWIPFANWLPKVKNYFGRSYRWWWLRKSDGYYIKKIGR